MDIFTESTCLNWFNESSYKPIISWEEVEDILNICKSFIDKHQFLRSCTTYTTKEKYDKYAAEASTPEYSKTNGKYHDFTICSVDVKNKSKGAVDAVANLQKEIFEYRKKTKKDFYIGGGDGKLFIRILKIDNEYIARTKIPQVLKDIIKRIKELDKQYHAKYKNECYYKITILTQAKIKENISDELEGSEFATVDIIDVKDDKKWKDPNLSRTEFIDQVNSRWQIFGDLINDIQKEFKGYIDYDGDKFNAQIYFINKDNE